jgi:AraC-like DNA-binding protein
MVDSLKNPNRFFFLTLDSFSRQSMNLVYTIGYQSVARGKNYPLEIIPKRYSFNMNRGRYLSEYQLVYITSGTGVFKDKSGLYTVKSGDIFLLKPGYWHAYKPNPETGWTEYFIGFDGPAFRDIINKDIPQLTNPINLGSSPVMVDLFEQSLYYGENQNEYTPSILTAIIIHMLTYIQYSMGTRNMTNDRITQAVNYVKKYLMTHISSDVDFKQLAEEQGMSYTWMRRMFKERTGLAPGQYLQKIRITSAMFLLRNTEMPVKNIAFECGFKTSEYFCTVFLDATGMSPGKYREANLVSEA